MPELTARGAATRARIVSAAAALVAVRGVAGTSLDDVREATATSKSQLYHYFTDKAALVRAVIDYQTEAVLAAQRLDDEPLDSFEALRRWRYRTLADHRAHGFDHGCRLGRLAAELGDADPETRAHLAAAWTRWRDQLSTGLTRLVDEGLLPPRADPTLMATGLLAALQGGLLLSAPSGDPTALRWALDQAIKQILLQAVPATADPSLAHDDP